MNRYAKIMLLGLIATTVFSTAYVKTAKVYLAGPDVFRPNAQLLGERKKEICKKHGIEGFFPLDNALDLSNKTPHDMAMTIFQANIELMHSCDAVIANMTPYRSPSMDVGTAFEMGFMFGQNKPVFGYTNNSYKFFERTCAWAKEAQKTDVKKDQDGFYRDGDKNSLEAFEGIDNLMLDGAVASDTKKQVVVPMITTDVEDLTMFEECVKLVAQFFLDKKLVK